MTAKLSKYQQSIVDAMRDGAYISHRWYANLCKDGYLIKTLGRVAFKNLKEKGVLTLQESHDGHSVYVLADAYKE